MTNTNLAGRIGRWSAQHRKKAIFGWLTFVIVSLTVGFNLVPAKEIEGQSGLPGETGQAARALEGAFPTRLRSRFLFRARNCASATHGSRTRLEM